ncbi:MAG: hypothetical protein JW827_12585, partial [Spirochaetes bacterium]|nr:hypothetical protein [Spirochaetota bacterium]
SREYEPWGRTPEKDLYMNLMQLKFDFEMKYAAERFLDLINNYDFLVYNKKVRLDIRILAYSCDTQKFEWKLGEGEEETVKTIIQRIIEELKSQKKPLVISKDSIND